MKLGQAVLNLLFPPKCPFCRRILDKAEDGLCPDCQKNLPWLIGTSGERKVEFADGCFSPLAYRDRVRDGVHHFKFEGSRACAEPFGELMAQCLQDHLPEEVDAITWAPLNRKRKRKRGFDQAELLARAVGRRQNLPVISVLRKVHNTQPQSALTQADQRRANAKGAYCLREGVEVAGLRLVLVDDVVTSGATLSECAFQLRKAGAQRVWCLTLAQARRGGKAEGDRKN